MVAYITFLFPALLTDPPHPAAVQQVSAPSLVPCPFLLSPSQSGSLVLTIKKLPIWLEEDIIAIMTAVALHITQYTDCSAEE